jgi:hypothetical protein
MPPATAGRHSRHRHMPRRRVTARRAITALVSAFFLYLAYRAVRDGGLTVLAHVSALPILAAMCCLFIGNNVLSGLRWWALQGYPGRPSTSVRKLSESIFFSVILPTGSIGGDVYRGVNTRAAAPVVADRLIGASVTGTCAAAALPALLRVPTWVSFAAGLAAAVAMWVLWKAVTIVRIGPRKVRNALASLSTVTTPLSRVGPAVLLTIGYVAFNALFLLCLAHAVSANLSISAAIVGSPIVLAAGALPNVHGLSFLQVALAAVLLRAGAAHDQAAAAAAVQLVGTYALALIGGALLVTGRLRSRTARPQARQSEAISS